MSQPTAETGYFLVADILGFSRIVHNSPDPAILDARISEWVSLVQTTAKKFALDRFQLISDTLFVAVPSTVAALACLLDFSRQLLTDGIEKSFPLRGAIVHGPFVWGEMIYGNAVIQAHELERQQNWIGITCANNMPGLDTLFSVDRVVCYPPPLKNTEILLHPVVAWPVPDAERLANLLTWGHLTVKGEHLNWEFGEKATNTAVFGLYLEIMRASSDGRPAAFPTGLPITVLSNVFQQLKARAGA